MGTNFGGDGCMAFSKIKDIDVHYEYVNNSASETIVLLHGFTGSLHTWDEVLQEMPKSLNFVLVDLIGHGETDAPADVASYTMESQIDVLHGLCTVLQLPSFYLLGYSMGGRVALSYTVSYPEMVKQLILESASPGLDDEEARHARTIADEKLADKIEIHGIANFVSDWENIPLFASQKRLPEQKQKLIREERLHQKALGLANSLRGMGTGVMPSVWHALPNLSMPITLVTGGLDKKFITLAEKMVACNQNIRHITTSNVGHAIHVENPQKFATIVKEIIL